MPAEQLSECSEPLHGLGAVYAFFAFCVGDIHYID